MARIEFKETIPFYDPEFLSIDTIVCGEANVTDADGTDDQRVADLAKMTVKNAVLDAFMKISDRRISYQELPGLCHEIEEMMTSAIRERQLVCDSIRISSIAPSEESVKRIEELAKLKKAASMSPQELAEKAREAQREAEEALSKMSPEERAKAEEEAKKLMAEFEQKNKEIMDSVQKIMADKAPRFCPNCGTPNNGFQFCPNCGNKLSG